MAQKRPEERHAGFRLISLRYRALFGSTRPYYVEKWGDWVTHESWSADGEEMTLIRQPDVLTGDRDDHVFRVETHSRRVIHHCCFSRDRRFICADSLALNAKYAEGTGVVRDDSQEYPGGAAV